MSEPASDLSGVGSVAELAAREGYEVEEYTIRLATHLRTNEAPLSAQRERLQVLAGLGAGADRAAADTLAQHHQILEALFQRFSVEAVRWAAKAGEGRASEVSERFLGAALRAQAAAVKCLSSLKALRDTPTAPATSASGPTAAADAGPAD